VNVPYSSPISGFGSTLATVGGYSDFWTSITLPTIDAYWANPSGTTAPCGITTCSLYLPNASTASCKLPSTNGVVPTVPSNQVIGTPSPAAPVTTSASPVSYTAWESYIGDQAVPAFANLGAIANVSPWSISASNSNPLGYSHTVCYACSFGYNVMSPTLGRVTAKINISANQ